MVFNPGRAAFIEEAGQALLAFVAYPQARNHLAGVLTGGISIGCVGDTGQ
jgi:hypothetical protein